MTTCSHCGNEYTADQLIRHERPRLVVIHCPGCNAPLGQYRRHGDDPHVDLAKRA
ncbi:hypothetical protein [Haladaptatus sp. DYSN1]|uniref:hypothetical protein n=1 Tax=unclassified Haladaptatus TaxID=2622732 RepID=UPI0024065830|nr:hypothetical protein [Haladaptatus sp. DYSN1]